MAENVAKSEAAGPRAGQGRVCVGRIARAHGVAGILAVQSYTEDPADVTGYPVVYAGDMSEPMHLTRVGEKKGFILVRVAGVCDRTAAERMCGLMLWVDRTSLPPTAEDEFYHADLIGLEALLQDPVSGNRQPWGKVRAVHDFGAGALLDVSLEEGRSVLVPFTRAVVPDVDLRAGILTVADVPGLLTDESPPIEAHHEESVIVGDGE